MLRCCLRAVRTFGGHSTNARSCYFFSQQASPLSRPQFMHLYVERAAFSTDLVEEPGSPIVASSSTRFFRVPTRDNCRLQPSSASRSSIHNLRQFLSPENVTSDRSFVYSPATIRSFYYRAESRNQLGALDSQMLTLLMGLFGSLSVDPRVSVAYRNPLAGRVKSSTRRTHWAFVLKVGRHKLQRGMTLQASDRFWLMHAELATARVEQPLESLSSDAYNAVLRARTHYHVIRRHCRHPEVHVHYLEALLAIRDPRLLNFVACDLSFLMRKHTTVHPRLQHLLYHLAIEYGGNLSTRSQEVILAALWSRYSQGPGGPSDLVPENGVADMDDCILDTTKIAHSLSTILFGTDRTPPGYDSEKLFGYLFSIFSPAHALPLRWSSLVLLSIFNSSHILHLTGTHWTSNHAVPQVALCWQVIFGLSAVEKAISQEPSSALAKHSVLIDGVLKMTRTLNQLWLPTIKLHSVPRGVECAVATSFLRIASILADSTLFHDYQELYRAKNSSDASWVLRTPVSKLLAAQYIAAALRVQGPFLDVVHRALETLSVDLQQQHQVLASAVEALASIDPSLAHMLYTVMQGTGMEFDFGATYALTMSLARRGQFREAMRLVNDDPFPLDKRGILISVIARGLRENPRTRHPPDVFVAIVDELAALYQSHPPPEHFRGHLEQLLVVLADHGRGSQLFPVLLSIIRMSPNFFQPRFFIRYCHILVRHRQFSTASKFLDVIAAVHPKMAQALCIRVDRMVMQTNATRSRRRIIPLCGLTSLRLTAPLRRHSHTGLPLEISIEELLKAGRVLAAKRIFACAAAATSSRRRTALGNIILHGVSRHSNSRNGRRVAKVLLLLESLVKNHGFRPDRVTANILLKVMINWRSAFDSSRLRVLFDQVVRSGYPAANYSPSHPPFNTRRTEVTGSSDFSKLPPFISFEKHTKPLFKMFIKALYSCNDMEAARKVVGILKVEERKNAVTKEARQRARSRGRVKAGRRNMIPFDVNVPSID